MSKLRKIICYIRNTLSPGRQRSRKDIICLKADDYTALVNKFYDLDRQVKELELHPLKDLRKAHIDKTRQAALLFNRSHEMAECLTNDQLERFALMPDGYRLRYMYVNFIVDTENEKSVEQYLKLLQISKYALDLKRRL